MKIITLLDNSTFTVYVEGRLDTTSAPELDKELENIPSSVTEIIFDFANLEYISSAGLRILLKIIRQFPEAGTVKIRNANADVRDIFNITGFIDLLTLI